MSTRRSTPLNPRQRVVVEHDAGVVLVLAGAGTGKTHTITSRIARLLGKGVPPGAILAVTFTNKAAAEMRERIRRAAGGRRRVDGLTACTFHSFCARILREHWRAAGLPRDFTIADTGEQAAILRKAMRFLDGHRRLRPRDVLQRISRMKSAGVSSATAGRRAIEPEEMTVAALYERYEEALRRIRAVDFDDLVIRAARLLEENGEVRAGLQRRYRHILVDEFQDTSARQCRLVQMLAAHCASLCVVGDDDQSIYSWRGAVPGNILDFGKHFPGADIVCLEENYRSTNTILQAAGALIANNEKRHPKRLRSRLGPGEKIRVLAAEDQEDEAERIAAAVAREVRAGRARPASFAVIVRTNAQTRPLEQELRAQHLPYVVIGGTSFFERKEARDLLSYLTVVANPAADAALLRIINTPARGIGDRAVELLAAQAQAAGVPLARVLATAATVPGLGERAVAACGGLAADFRAWRARARAGELHDLVERIIDDIRYQDEVVKLCDDPLEQAARMNLAREVGEGLRAFLARDAGAGLRGFLHEAMLWGKDEGTARDRDRDAAALKLITVHSAKGLEFERVYLAGFEEELLPHRNAIEAGDVSEERRLCYVAMTRAKRELVLSFCKARNIRGKRVERRPSRFLEELPSHLLERRDRVLPGDERRSFARAMLARMQAREEGAG